MYELTFMKITCAMCIWIVFADLILKNLYKIEYLKLSNKIVLDKYVFIILYNTLIKLLIHH